MQRKLETNGKNELRALVMPGAEHRRPKTETGTALAVQKQIENMRDVQIDDYQALIAGSYSGLC